MPSKYYPRYSLRDLFRIGGSRERHRLGRSSHRKSKHRQHQETYPPRRRSRRTYYDDEPLCKSHFVLVSDQADESPRSFQLSILNLTSPRASAFNLRNARSRLIHMSRPHKQKTLPYAPSAAQESRSLRRELRSWTSSVYVAQGLGSRRLDSRLGD
jgi:hypothetical protein